MTNDVALIESFRETHHAIARMYASGMSEMLICRMTGFTTRRLSLLRNTPAFDDLISYYSERADSAWTQAQYDLHQAMILNLAASERKIRERFEKNEEEGVEEPLSVLNKIAMDRADRLGYGKNTRIDVRVDFATELDRALEKSNKAKVIENVATRVGVAVIEDARGTPSHENLPAPQGTPADHPALDVAQPGSHTSPPKKPNFAELLGPKRRKV